MYFSLASGFLLSGVALFMAYLIALFLLDSRQEKMERNHLRNSFPYNFFIAEPIPMRMLLYILFILSLFFLIVGESLFFVTYNNTYHIILSILFPLSLLCLGVSHLLPLSSYKAHIIFSSIAFFLYSISCIAYCFVTVMPGAMPIGKSACVPILVIIGVFGFATLISLVNPKLKNWAKMDKTEINGKTIYVKPKVNAYALTEWIVLLEEVITALLLFFTILTSDTLEFNV